MNRTVRVQEIGLVLRSIYVPPPAVLDEDFHQRLSELRARVLIGKSKRAVRDLLKHVTPRARGGQRTFESWLLDYIIWMFMESPHFREWRKERGDNKTLACCAALADDPILDGLPSTGIRRGKMMAPRLRERLAEKIRRRYSRLRRRGGLGSWMGPFGPPK